MLYKLDTKDFYSDCSYYLGQQLSLVSAAVKFGKT